MRKRLMLALLAIVASLGLTMAVAQPANAGSQERVCNRSTSTQTTYIKVRHGLSTPAIWENVYPGFCSSGYATYFVSYTGDCYSDWGTRYNKGTVYRLYATGNFYLRCYIT